MLAQPHVDNDFDSEEIVCNYIRSKLDRIDCTRVNVIVDLIKEKRDVSGVLVDVGCGHGDAARIFAEYFDHVIGIDASPLQISLGRQQNNPENVEFRVGIAENLSSIANESLDVITSIFTLQLLNDVDAFIKECRRVLKQNGIAIFYMEIVTAIESVERDNLPTIADTLNEAHCKSLEIARALPHHQRHVLGRYQELFESLNWTSKSRVERKVDVITDLDSLRQCYLSIPFYAKLGNTANSPLIKAFDDVKKIWLMEDLEDKDVRIRATFDTVAIMLNSPKF